MVAIKTLPLVLVSIMANLVPLVTAVLSYFILGEKLNTIERIGLVVSFAGVAVMVSAKYSNGPGYAYPLYALATAMLIPVTGSLIQILLRSMKHLSAHTQTFYHALFTLAVMTLVTLLSQEGLSFLSGFSLLQWVFLALSAAFAFAN